MLREYRAWLQSQISPEGEPADTATVQRSAMARMALERLDSDLRGALPLALDAPAANRLLAALEMLEQTQTHLDPALADLRQNLRDVLAPKSSGDVTGGPSTE